MRRFTKCGFGTLFLVAAFLLFLPAAQAQDFTAAQALNAWEPGSPHFIASFPHVSSLVEVTKRFSPEGLTEEPLMAWFHPYDLQDVAFAAGLNDGVIQVQGVLSYGPGAAEWLKTIAEGTIEEDVLDMLEAEEALVEGPEELEGVENGLFYTMVLDEDEPMARMLFTARDNLLIFGYTEKNLKSSLKAMEDPELRLAPERHYPELENYIAYNDGGLTQIGILGNELPIFLHDAIKGEIAFGTEEDQWGVRIYSTTAKAWFGEELLDIMPPLENETPLIGGGRALLAVAAATDFLALKNAVLSLMNDEEVTSLYNEGIAMLSSMGLSEKTITDLLTGSVHFVLGGQAATMFAPFPLPGGYLVVRGQGDAAQNVAELAAAMATQAGGMPLQKMELPGWDTLYGISMPATVLLGAKGSDLYIGFLDPQKANEPSDASPRMKELASAKETRMAWVYLDIFGVDQFLLDTMEKHEMWTMLAGGMAGDIGHGVLLAHDYVTSIAEGMLAESFSFEEGHIALLWNTLPEKTQKRWEDLRSSWIEQYPTSFVDMLESAMNVELQDAPEGDGNAKDEEEKQD